MSGGTGHKLAVAAQLLESVAQDLLMKSEVRLPKRDAVMRDELHALNTRREVLPAAMQTPIAWVIMAELYLAHVEGRNSCVKHVQLACEAPETTVLRYLNLLVDDGWVIRTASKSDKRVVELEATEAAIERIEAWAYRRAGEIYSLIRPVHLDGPARSKGGGLANAFSFLDEARAP